MKAWIEESVLQLIPGYTLLKGLGDQAGDSETAKMKTALLGGAGNWSFCFIVERHPNGYLTVFRPSAPSPTSGAVLFVSPDQVKEVDIPVVEVMRCLMRDGGGSVDLLRDKLKSGEGSR